MENMENNWYECIYSNPLLSPYFCTYIYPAILPSCLLLTEREEKTGRLETVIPVQAGPHWHRGKVEQNRSAMLLLLLEKWFKGRGHPSPPLNNSFTEM